MKALVELRQTLVGHPMYRLLNTPARLRLFMEHHVFAVWDFMSLIKRLQLDLTGLTLPWIPPHRAYTRLVNEIVLAEESDDDGRGAFSSHFELYLEAMEQAGAQTAPMMRFIAAMSRGEPVQETMQQLGIPKSVQHFVQTTLAIAQRSEIHEVCAAFFFGREEIIPGMFEVLLQVLRQQNTVVDRLEYYLQRHMHIDAEVHGPMAKAMLNGLCGDSAQRWQAAQACAERSPQARVLLWDGVVDAIRLPPRDDAARPTAGA